jgi:hypothetical protein
VSDEDAYDPAGEAEHWAAVVANEPRNAEAWYDLGLAHKYLSHWRESADANLRALELGVFEPEPAWWNLGIAATGLRDWALARRAWRGFGIASEILPDGVGPIEVNWGPSPVRLLAGDDTREVVWGRRIDPARIRIESIPFPQSGHRWHDIVLHDGAPRGERRVEGRVYDVFDELERWAVSEIPTLRCDARCVADDDSTALVDAFEEACFAAEDWTANVRSICKACSEGAPDETHVHSVDELPDVRAFGIAAPLGLARRVLDAWRSASPATRDFDELEPIG